MRHILLATSALLLSTSLAYATPTCVGNNNCNDNSTTNEGGTGVGVGIGIGEGGEGGNATIERDAVRNTNTNTNTNTNVNSATAVSGANALAHQGQLQGQLQGQAVSVDASTHTDFPVSTAIAPSAQGNCQSFIGAAGQGDSLGVSGLIPISSNWCRIVNMMNWLATNVNRQAAVRYGCISEDDFAEAVGEAMCNAVSTSVTPTSDKPVASLNYKAMQPINE